MTTAKPKGESALEFVNFQFASDVAKTEAISNAERALQTLRDVLGERDARDVWLQLLPKALKGTPPGPRKAELTRQLLMFYQHWQFQFPDREDGELRSACVKMLHAERPGEFGNSEAAIMRQLQRLLPGKKKRQK